MRTHNRFTTPPVFNLCGRVTGFGVANRYILSSALALTIIVPPNGANSSKTVVYALKGGNDGTEPNGGAEGGGREL